MKAYLADVSLIAFEAEPVQILDIDETRLDGDTERCLSVKQPIERKGVVGTWGNGQFQQLGPPVNQVKLMLAILTLRQ